MATESSVEVAGRGENFLLHALLGAVVTTVTSFVPFSPIIGGAVAGYLHDSGTGRGLRVGAVAGLIATLPLALVFFVLFGIMSIGSITTGEFAGPVFVIMLVGTILLFAALYVVGLSALGGYAGSAFADSRTERRIADELGTTDATPVDAAADDDATAADE